MVRTTKKTEQAAIPAELAHLHEQEHLLKDLMDRQERTEERLKQAQGAHEAAQQRREALAHLIGGPDLEDARGAERKAHDEIDRLTEDLADISAGIETLKRSVLIAEEAARRACQRYWRERKETLLSHIAPLAEQLQPLARELYHAQSGMVMSYQPIEQFVRETLLPAIQFSVDGPRPEVPISSPESRLLDGHERYRIRESLRRTATKAEEPRPNERRNWAPQRHRYTEDGNLVPVIE